MASRIRLFCFTAAIMLALSSAIASSHVSREGAVQLLRHEGVLQGKTHVVSASWEEATRQWLITLRHPSGTLSVWFVDAAGQNYHGGPCKR
jgi:hypothetical protein